MKFDFDPYSRKARLMPVLLVVFPIGLSIVAWLSGELSGWGTLIGLFTPFGLTPFLAQAGRDLGKRKEKLLFQMWGGKPTTRLLRHRDHTLNALTKARYHTKLQALLPDLTIPRAEQESKDMDQADTVYDSCTNYLIERTRKGEENHLIFAENINYGYRRNLWAMKPAGLTIAAIGVCCCSLKIISDARSGELSAIPFAAAAVSAALTVWWALRINPNWIHTAGEEYARRLLERCETLPENRNTSKIITA
jgi:hypothetical protein